MPAEEWTVSAKLVGDFLIRKEHVSATAPLTEGLRQLSIYPEVDSMVNGRGSIILKPYCRLKKARMVR